MFHDAIVPVTCDGKCGGIIMIDIPRPMSSVILDALIKGNEWTVIDGKHYCSEECASEADGKST